MDDLASTTVPGTRLRRRPAVFGGLAALLLPGLAASQAVAKPPRLDVPYVPTDQAIVDRMLEIAQVGPTDVLYDLGCGDGRIVVTAARARYARGVGIDIDPERIREARQNARAAGVADRVEFRTADLFQSDFSDATVVTLYLLPTLNRRLRPQLWRQLRVGTRVVSHDFDMGREWPADRIERVAGARLHYWVIRPQHKERSG